MTHPLFSRAILPKGYGITTIAKERVAVRWSTLYHSKREALWPMGLLWRAMDESYLCRVMSSWIWASLTFTWRAFPYVFLLTFHLSVSAVANSSLWYSCSHLLWITKGTIVYIRSSTPQTCYMLQWSVAFWIHLQWYTVRVEIRDCSGCGTVRYRQY